MQICVLRCAAHYLDGSVCALVIIKVNAHGGAVNILTEAEGFTHMGLLLCSLDRIVSSIAFQQLILACGQLCVEGEDTNCALLGLEAILVIVHKAVVDIEVVCLSVTDQLQLHRITAGEGHAGNCLGYSIAPIISAAGRLVDNAHILSGLVCLHIHKELDHFGRTVDLQAELGIIIIVQNAADIKLSLEAELVGKLILQVCVLRRSANHLDSSICALVIVKDNTIGSEVSILAGTEVFAHMGFLLSRLNCVARSIAFQQLVLACGQFCIEGEDTHCALLILETILVVQYKGIVHIEVVCLSVSDQLHLHSVAAGEGHTGNICGYNTSPIISAAGGLVDNTHLIGSLIRLHVHEEFDHFGCTVDLQTELGPVIATEHIGDIELRLEAELVGKHIVQICVLGCATKYLDGGILTLILTQVDTVGGLIAIYRTEGLTPEDFFVQDIGECLIARLVHVNLVIGKQFLVGVLSVSSDHRRLHIDALHIGKAVAQFLCAADQCGQLIRRVLSVRVSAGTGRGVDVVDLCLRMIRTDLLQQGLQLCYGVLAAFAPYIHIIAAN